MKSGGPMWASAPTGNVGGAEPPPLRRKQMNWDLVIKITFAVFSAAATGWAIWMMKKHWSGDPATKHRQRETVMMPPAALAVIGTFILPVMGALVLFPIKDDSLLKNSLLWSGFFSAIGVLFVLFGTRQVIIYDYDRMRHRSAFGKLRVYDFSEIRSMTPVMFDLLVHVGRRWILIDMQQDWHPLWDVYHSWQKRNGIPIKKREYKTKIGRFYGETPGGIAFLIVLTLFSGGGAVLFFTFAWMGFRKGQIGAGLGILAFGILCLFLLASLYIEADKEKHPKFSKFWWGDRKQWGVPREKRKKNQDEKKDDD